MREAVLNFDFLEKEGFQRIGKGKSRELFQSVNGRCMNANQILIAVTDCVSAFDEVLPDSAFEGKGRIANQLSDFWFQQTASIAPNHRLGIQASDWPSHLDSSDERLKGRAIVVWKAKPLPAECIARGYLAGSAWREYQRCGMVCGQRLPAGLREAEELPEPIFTPTTKAKIGKDENISFGQFAEIVGGEEKAERIRDYSLRIYKHARSIADAKGVLIADAKFEFGIRCDNNSLIVIDEMLTPDAARLWLKKDHCPGKTPNGLDKQIARDYLEKTGWNKKPPAPSIPKKIVRETQSRYIQACERLTSKPLDN